MKRHSVEKHTIHRGPFSLIFCFMLKIMTMSATQSYCTLRTGCDSFELSKESSSYGVVLDVVLHTPGGGVRQSLRFSLRGGVEGVLTFTFWSPLASFAVQMPAECERADYVRSFDTFVAPAREARVGERCCMIPYNGSSLPITVHRHPVSLRCNLPYTSSSVYRFPPLCNVFLGVRTYPGRFLPKGASSERPSFDVSWALSRAPSPPPPLPLPPPPPPPPSPPPPSPPPATAGVRRTTPRTGSRP